MKEVTDKNFGVVIAFWLPGFVLLWGLSYSYSDLSKWLSRSGNASTTIGEFLYLSLASLALGMVVSAVRWMSLDKAVMPLLWVREEPFDYAKLKDRDAFAIFQGAVENYYRFYQYYSNTLVSVVTALIAYAVVGKEEIGSFVWVSIGVVCIALLLGSRDSLQKYYKCRAQIAGVDT